MDLAHIGLGFNQSLALVKKKKKRDGKKWLPHHCAEALKEEHHLCNRNYACPLPPVAESLAMRHLTTLAVQLEGLLLLIADITPVVKKMKTQKRVILTL